MCVTYFLDKWGNFCQDCHSSLVSLQILNKLILSVCMRCQLLIVYLLSVKVTGLIGKEDQKTQFFKRFQVNILQKDLQLLFGLMKENLNEGSPVLSPGKLVCHILSVPMPDLT